MLYLVGTGVLLRAFNRSDPENLVVRQCLRALKRAGHALVVSTQNVAEFWNVSTRPASARGGYGLSLADTEKRVKLIERFCEVLPDSPNLLPHLAKTCGGT